ncbi:27 kDa antigen Cfp30B [Planctomycetes bacterium Pla163]|uniref:27 kDa antigen Cfp30B n=1 Tax=Rohdeia mirabilis TaxID=2528008 RepID=A0A518D1A5_9BACT|nr:27 kDa antigen Cfp30B [Planctomycetes bacterium Pla163]
MPTHASFQPGEFCWVDLVAHDMQTAMEFYGELFGWTAEVQNTYGGPPYAMFMKDGAVVGGIGQMSDEMMGAGIPPMWNSYVATDDCEATEARARELGALVTVPTMEVPSMGKLAFFVDQEGASIACWQSTNDDGVPFLKGEHGSLSWNELMNRDTAGAKALYGGLFDWDFVAMPMGDTRYEMIKAGSVDAGGMMAMDGERFDGVPAHWLVYFQVDDGAQGVAAAEEAGATVMVPLTEIPVGRFSVLSDPQGAVFCLIELAG